MLLRQTPCLLLHRLPVDLEARVSENVSHEHGSVSEMLRHRLFPLGLLVTENGSESVISATRNVRTIETETDVEPRIPTESR